MIFCSIYLYDLDMTCMSWSHLQFPLTQLHLKNQPLRILHYSVNLTFLD